MNSSDIHFDCPKCGKSLVIDEEGSGRTIKCPDCSQPIIVPPKSTTTQPAPAPKAREQPVPRLHTAPASSPPAPPTVPTSPAPGIAIKQKTLVIAGVVLVAVIAVVVIATGLLVSDKNSKPMPEAGRADQEHRKQPAGAEPQPTVESLKECVLTVTKQMNDRLASEAEQKWSLIVKVSGKKKGYILEDANCLLKEGSQIAVGMGLSQALWELQDKIDSAKNEGEPRPVLAPDAEVWAYSKYSKFAAPVVVDIKTDSSSTIYSHEGIVRFSSRKVSCRGKATLTGFFSENELDKDWGNPFADGPGQENAKRKAVTDAAMEMFKTSPIIEEGDSLPYTTVIYRWHREKRCWVGQKIEKD